MRASVWAGRRDFCSFEACSFSAVLFLLSIRLLLSLAVQRFGATVSSGRFGSGDSLSRIPGRSMSMR